MELLVILLVAVVVVGPEKMPSIMRTLAKMLAEFRRVKTDFHRLMNLELANLEQKNPPKPEAQPDPGPEPVLPSGLPVSIEASALAPGSTEPDAQQQNPPPAAAQAAAVEEDAAQAAAVAEYAAQTAAVEKDAAQEVPVADKEGRDGR
jgi:sec-independent protein translocase protein TatB